MHKLIFITILCIKSFRSFLIISPYFFENRIRKIYNLIISGLIFELTLKSSDKTERTISFVLNG